MITTYLKETIIYIIDHFRYETRRHFNLSFRFFLMTAICLIPLGFLYGVVGGYTYGFLSFADDLTMTYTKVLDLGIVTQVYQIVRAFSIIAFGLYGSFIISTINDVRLQSKDKFTWSDFTSFISRDEWVWFIKFVVAITIIYFITFQSLVSFVYLHDHEYSPDANQSHFWYRLLRWLDSIIGLFRAYLPYLFSILFIITVYENRLDRDILRKYKDSIITGFIFSYILYDLISTLLGYFSTYVGGLVDVIFLNSITILVPGFFRGALLLLGTAYVNWVIAASLCLPIKFQSESEDSATPDPHIDPAADPDALLLNADEGIEGV